MRSPLMRGAHHLDASARADRVERAVLRLRGGENVEAAALSRRRNVFLGAPTRNRASECLEAGLGAIAITSAGLS